MKTSCFGTVGLVIAVLYHSQQVIAQGTLNFVTLYSPNSLLRDDDTSSLDISTYGSFPFGTGYINSVSVSENGYISMGEPRCSGLRPLSPSSYCSVVAPYGADSNTEIAGTVQYTDFYTYTSTGHSMTTVSRFIRDETGDNFYGNRMMVAEWNGVAEYRGSSFTTNTFQGILITDDTDSYAVFIYECGGMEWGGGGIGWRDGSSEQVTHPLNGSSNSSDIGCLYSETYSAIVYRLHSTCDFHEFTCYNGGCTPQRYVCDQDNDCGDYSDEDGCGYRCPSYQFTCDNGDCINENYRCDNYNDCGDNSDEGRCDNYCPSYQLMCDNGDCYYKSDECDGYNNCGDNSDEEGCDNYCSSYQLMCDNGDCYYESDKCDGYNDCGDNSDEEGCGTDVNVGLAVGLSVGLFFLILVIGVPLCIVMVVYCLSRRSNRPVRTRIVATAPSPGATTVLTSSQAGTSSAAPVQYPQQPVYKDAKFSNQDAPPSYTDATAYPQAAQGYNQYQTIPAAAYPQQQNTSYPPQNQAYPQAVPYFNQAYPPPNLAYPPA